MAFTIEEVEKALITPRHEWPMYFPQNADRQKSSNYETITSYLTGKSNSLGAIQQDYGLHWFNTLINLLKDVDNISENDQLVLDVFLEPKVHNYLGNVLNSWLLQYLFEHTSGSALQAVLRLFKKQSIPDDEIFYLIVFLSPLAKVHYAGIEGTALEDYLLNYVKNRSTLINFAYGQRQWHTEQWSLLYFQLLEKANPTLAEDYAVSSIYFKSTGAELFITYSDGKYLPVLVAELQSQKYSNNDELHMKLSFATKLYFSAPATYKNLVIETAENYLEAYANKGSTATWESYIAIASYDAENEYTNLKSSSAAFYFLLENEYEKIADILNLFFKNKTFVPVESMQVLHRYLGETAYPYFEKNILSGAGIDIYGFREYVNFLQEKFNAEVYLPLIWNFSNSKSKATRELVAKVVAEQDTNAEDKALEKLQHKSAEVRQTAAMILGFFPGTKSRDAVLKVLDSEKNDIARDILLQSVEANLPTESSLEFINQMICAAKERLKLDKPVLANLNEESLPPLYYQSGTRLSQYEVRFLLYRMSRIKEMRSDIEARYLLKLIDKERSNEFALSIMQFFKDTDSKPEDKWVLALAALLGNDTVADKTRTFINKWIDNNRYKMTEYGVGALALQGSDTALRWVEWYSRKYKSKKANVGAAALKALEAAAEELGISIQELGDKVVPDFGFDGLFKTFTAEGDEYRAFIDSNFKIAFFDEDNKKLKAIPATADKLIKDEFKNIAKEVREVVKSQSPRLEYYLIIQRRWSLSNWQVFFLQNPVMFIYATKTVWGVYDAENNLVQTFICNEDTSLLNIERDEIIIDENSKIGIVHPTQLSKEELKQWEKVFFDMKIDTVFPQLSRYTGSLSGFDMDRKIITKFVDFKTKEGSIRNTLERHGWSQGPVGDGGMVESFKLLYLEKKMEAVLEVYGVGAGYGWGNEEKLNQLYFVDKLKMTQKWFYPKGNDDENLVTLNNVPNIFLSEVIAAIELIKPAEKE